MQLLNIERIDKISSPSKIEGAGGSMTPHTHNESSLKTFRRALRNNSTEAEKALWNWLKGNRIDGLRFRRQFSVEHFVLDFYCPKLRLAIELDGEYHYHGSVVLADYEREAYLLEKHGIKSYFSGCLTLTLGLKYKSQEKNDTVYFVDPFYELGGGGKGLQKYFCALGMFLKHPVKVLKLNKIFVA